MNGSVCALKHTGSAESPAKRRDLVSFIGHPFSSAKMVGQKLTDCLRDAYAIVAVYAASFQTD
jgi:hypothetical protein